VLETREGPKAKVGDIAELGRFERPGSLAVGLLRAMDHPFSRFARGFHNYNRLIKLAAAPGLCHPDL